MYNPHLRTKAMLQRAITYVNSVPYQVSLRWLFYRLLQDGTYQSKADYKNRFDGPLSAARKQFFGEWRPWTLADETRMPIYRGDGHANAHAWLEAVGKVECTLSKWAFQREYVEFWYEARAMTAQFEHYTKDITLRPFGGQMSIPAKWEIVEHFKEIKKEFPDKDIAIIYFGDNDKAGFDIQEAALRDIRAWCGLFGIEFDFYRAGLNPGQEIEFNIPENFEHPGSYQWEALSDESARTIIESTLAKYPVTTAECAKLEQNITKRFQDAWPDFMEELEEAV